MTELELLRGLGMMAEVAAETGVSMWELQRPTEAPNSADKAHGARRLFAKRMRKAGASWPQIGQLLCRHHATVMHMAGALKRRPSERLYPREQSAGEPVAAPGLSGVTPPRAAVPLPIAERRLTPVAPPPVGRWGS